MGKKSKPGSGRRTASHVVGVILVVLAVIVGLATRQSHESSVAPGASNTSVSSQHQP